MQLSAHQLVELERMMDQHGLKAVLVSLSEITAEKAEHVRSTWQAHNMARDWDAISHYLAHVADTRTIMRSPI